MTNEKKLLMKTVASFRDVYQAHIIKGRLETEGIRVELVDENFISINWMISNAVGGVKVQVPEKDYDAAIQILNKETDEEFHKLEESKNNVIDVDICPVCGSCSISPKRYSRWSLIPAMIFIMPFFFPLKKWSCDKCGASWH